MNIVGAMRREELFGPFFRGQAWAAWEVVLKGLFGLGIPERPIVASSFDYIRALVHDVGERSRPAGAASPCPLQALLKLPAAGRRQAIGK